MDDLARIRGWYAEDLRLRTPIRRNLSVVEAFAAVPRERFLGPGPWRILPDNRLDQPFADARRRAALALPRRAGGDRPGAPAQQRHAELLGAQSRSPRPAARRARAAGRRRHRLLFGPARPRSSGRAAASRRSSTTRRSPRGRAATSRPGAQVEVVAGDGLHARCRCEVDAVVVFAGATHPAPLWLDRLAEGGRLMTPLTADELVGLRAARDRGTARRSTPSAIGWVGIFPCAGGRDAEAAERLRAGAEGTRGRGVGGRPARSARCTAASRGRSDAGPGTARPGSGSTRAPPGQRDRASARPYCGDCGLGGRPHRLRGRDLPDGHARTHCPVSSWAVPRGATLHDFDAVRRALHDVIIAVEQARHDAMQRTREDAADPALGVDRKSVAETEFRLQRREDVRDARLFCDDANRRLIAVDQHVGARHGRGHAEQRQHDPDARDPPPSTPAPSRHPNFNAHRRPRTGSTSRSYPGTAKTQRGLFPLFTGDAQDVNSPTARG